MGKITDFFRKQIKNETNKLSKKYHGKYKKEELLQMAANSVLKKTMLMGGITVSCLAAGISGYCAISNAKENSNNDYNKFIEETTNLVKENDFTQDNDISSRIDTISSKADALKLIKELYLEEYNNVNKTEYTIDDISFYSLNQDYVYNVDDTYITHGSTPYTVENKLKKDNEDYEYVHDVKVYASFLIDGNKKVPLESFSLNNSNTINVIFADEYVAGKEINIENKNVLADMRSAIINGIDLGTAIENKNSEADITIRKYNLEKAIKKYQENHEKDVVENEIGGR